MLSKKRNFAENLKSIREARGISMEEFSKELGIPKTTLQSILKDGQTSLYTAIQISEKLQIPLDTLTNGTLSTRQINRLEGFVSHLEWYGKLPRDKREEALDHMMALIEIIHGADD